MKRRTYIKTVSLGAFTPLFFGTKNLTTLDSLFFKSDRVDFKSDWEQWPDMDWVGPSYWANRLQDWKIVNGRATCVKIGPNRNLNLLNIHNITGASDVKVKVRIDTSDLNFSHIQSGYAGIGLGTKSTFNPDFRRTAVFGEGLPIGILMDGNIIFGDSILSTNFSEIPKNFMLEIIIINSNLQIKISDPTTNQTTFVSEEFLMSEEVLQGGFSLISSWQPKEDMNAQGSVTFEHWSITSEDLLESKDHLFGPICFVQYTLQEQVLKLTAQLTPFEKIPNSKVFLELKKDSEWLQFEPSVINTLGRAVNFKIDTWDFQDPVSFRVKAILPLKSETREYVYEGKISPAPPSTELNVAVFSCNADFGFPDNDIVETIAEIPYDLAAFLGDQIYESAGPFNAEYDDDIDNLSLDYLGKWFLFGWSYREIFRNKPCVIIPDDHDVYHGNLWGSGGKLADTSKDFKKSAQDSGGYKMPTPWVNMVQFTQTSHLPDPYDPTPVKNDIAVYYTNWNYGGVSFAILEDRKFKSAPKNILPESAMVLNGFIENKDFDIKSFDSKEAELLGARQEKFLEEWVQDWNNDICMKVVLSQTPFATVATLPEDAISDIVVPKLKIPEKGEYVKGDNFTSDMDSNGWPKEQRDEAVKIIRKAFAFHIAGDQHLATFVQYGVENFETASYAFTAPALNNVWPRRFWPPVPSAKHSLEEPAYVGNHEDGFGNKFTLLAAGNPYNRNQEPSILYNRANGFGLVTIDKQKRTIKTACYERFKNPKIEDSQFSGWPITVHQKDNFLKGAKYSLPKIKVSSKNNVLPVIKVYQNNELYYCVRLDAMHYQPWVRHMGKYRILVEVPELKISKDLGEHKSKENNSKSITLKLDD